MKNVMIVLNYNDYETTSNYLNQVKNYKILDSIIVVDNNSSDNSYKRLKKYESKKIVILESDKNGGYGYGNNIGIKYAIKKYRRCNILISNPDIEVEEKVIIKMSSFLNDNNDVALVAPVVNELGNLNRGWELTNGFEELLLSIPFIGTKFRNKIIGYPNNYYNKVQTKVDVVSGCFFMIKSDIFKKINYFDENIFLYYEENVISKKLKSLNYDIIILNECSIVHNHSVSINKSHGNLKKYKILKKSQMYYLDNYTTASKLSKSIIKILSNIMIRRYERKNRIITNYYKN